MITTLKGSDKRGVYAVYWEQENDNTSLVVPASKGTPDKVKLMILEDLLIDLNIPIRIDEFRRDMIKRS